MDQLITSVDHLALDRYFSVIGATIWAYDYILTIWDEVTLLWSRKFSLVKVLYLTNRYVAVPYIFMMLYYLLGTLRGTTEQTATLCRFINISIVILRQIEVFASTWLVMMRVIVLFAQVKWVKWLLYSAFIITHVVTNGIMVQVVRLFYPDMIYVAPLRLCVSASPELIKVLYFLQIPFEFILFGFLLFHNWNFKRIIVTPSNIKPSPLLSALYMDGLLYFVATIAARVWAGCMIVLLDQTYWYMTMVVDFALSSVFISRIFLHLGNISESNTTTLAATSAPFPKQSHHAHPPAPPKIYDSNNLPPGATVNHVTHYAEGRGRISWTEMGRLDRPRQRKDYDSILEDA